PGPERPVVVAPVAGPAERPVVGHGPEIHGKDERVGESHAPGAPDLPHRAPDQRSEYPPLLTIHACLLFWWLPDWSKYGSSFDLAQMPERMARNRTVPTLPQRRSGVSSRWFCGIGVRLPQPPLAGYWCSGWIAEPSALICQRSRLLPGSSSPV